jgi:DNA-binding Lrp family transcriptional regulator
MHLTERDREIIRLVHRHRFLRSPQIVALVGESSQQLLRRLKLLYHHGYLERPRAQLDYYHQGGSRPMVYGLGNKGRDLLRQEYGDVVAHLNWSDKNQSVRRFFLEHALLVSEVMVSLELACRESGHIRLVTDHELRAENEGKLLSTSFHWNVNLYSGRTLGVIPDKVFALERSPETGPPNRAFFFLEADRGTMPVIRCNLAQTSFYRKLLAYEATWRQSIHKTRFGFHRFRVFTVTTSAERVSSLVDACSQLNGGHGLFLFTHRDLIQKPADIFSSIWKTGRGEAVGLLD